MAESFAFGLADRVLGKLTSALIQEVGLAWGVKSELEDLQGSLSSIHALLLDAEEKQATNRQLRDWLGKLKDVFYDAEDIVDEFEYEALRQRVVASGSFKTKVRSFLSSPKSLAFNLKMGHRVKNIKDRLDKIAADKSKYGLVEGIATTPVAPKRDRETHSFIRASDVIGRHDDQEKIVGLLKQCSESENVSVLPIVGIGGLGKTTLAKLAYNDKMLEGQFSIKMWVCVSDEFDIEKLTKKILKEIDGAENYMSDLSMEQLQSRLRSALNGRTFLLVLDDVWNSDREKWLKLKDLLMDGACGSKILVTTRKRSVAKIMGTIPTLELKGLSHADCMSLFVKCAFLDGEDRQHPKLLQIGEQIVEKCGGVPLAVRSLGSLLYSKRDERDWVFIRDNEIWESEDQSDQDGIMAALRLSYYDLPYHLKQCLVLCSLFPKDEVIPNYILIMFWMAHGLLQSSGQSARMEDIGEMYIQELLSRCFFQDIVHGITGIIYTFKMHDLVHDLAISFSKPEYSTLDFHSEDIPQKSRYIAFSDYYWPNEEHEAVKFLERLNNIRSIYFQMNECAPRDNSFVSTCILRYKCLRVLDMRRSRFESLPNSIGTLNHLRFLDISDNESIKKLPDSICKLYHLQTLLFKGCLELEELPSGIGSMIGLRRLFMTVKQRDLSKRQKRLRHLTSLQNLLIVHSSNLEILFKGMESFIALRELTIFNCPSLVYLPHGTKLLPTLEFLVIADCDKFNFMDEKEEEEEEDSPRFVSLRMLWFDELPQLEAPKWFIHGPGSSTLQYLHISKCPNFTAMPQNGLQKFSSLQVLEINDCLELTNKCNPENGEDWQKVAHIPQISLNGERIVK